MDTGELDNRTTGGNGVVGAVQTTTGATVDPAREAIVKEWCARVKESREFHKKAFDRIALCIKLARDGGDKEWVNARKYVAPIIVRHINMAVAQLYAKNPKTVVSRKPRMLYQIWDGKPETVQAALQAAMAGDVSAMPLLQEVQAAQQEMLLRDRMAKTVEIVDRHFMDEQSLNYKLQLKQLVRRTKITGVGYGKLGFQRLLGEGPISPDKEAAIADVRSRIEEIETIMARGQLNELQEDSADLDRLKSLMQALQAPDEIVVREGPVLSFPRSTQVIVDKDCHQLRTLAGANWIAYEYDMTPARILSTYDKDVSACFNEQQADKDRNKAAVKVWEVWDKTGQLVFTICDGYNDYLRDPEAPALKLERFWNLFVLTFNDIEDDPEDREAGGIYPPSDVWLARHAQDEYNRSREGLREHRRASRPYYVLAKGMIENSDRAKLADHDAHEIVDINMPASESMDIRKVLQPGPTAPIDPNLYETESVFADIQRSVGSQEANLGGTSGATATESSIAEQSRMATIGDNVDDLDEFLSEMARARGQLYFMELNKDTVLEIAGPGAVWPDLPQSREEAAKELVLDIQAGSSGRPNKAARLADLERAMPFIVQIPGINPKPFADMYMQLLDIEVEDAVVEGMPSIMAINAAMTKTAMQPSTGDPATDPAAQGANGGDNGQQPEGTPGGPQAAFPAAQEIMH